jgi:hypothetical protein
MQNWYVYETSSNLHKVKHGLAKTANKAKEAAQEAPAKVK